MSFLLAICPSQEQDYRIGFLDMKESDEKGEDSLELSQPTLM